MRSPEALVLVPNHVDVSVVVPVYMGRQWILTCLKSLSKQTFDRSRFETLLVFNGPEDGARQLVDEFQRANPDLQLRMLDCATMSASAARNQGSAAARGTYLTWLDCDDWISPEFLELMFLSAAKGIVPLAQIVNVDGDGVIDSDNLINTSILEHTETYVSPKDFPRGLSFMVCKLLPTWMARAVNFDEGLKSGEDVAVYGAMFARFPFTFSLNPAYAGARYYRLLRQGSVSRQAKTYDFHVQQRVDVIASLNRALDGCRPEARGLVTSFINSQASFIRRYFRECPEEQGRILDVLTESAFSYFPWANWFEQTHTLVIAYNFLPYADTGAVVAAKRIRQGKQPVDVVSHRMDNVRKANPDNTILAQPYVQLTGVVDGPAYFAGFSAITDFCVKGMKIVDGWEATKGRVYTELYSRAMWPASHFLAALYKVRNPSVMWRAEFSDPVQLSTTGEMRSAALKLDDVAEEILAGLEPAAQILLRENLNVYFWTEHLAYFLADELIFTNDNQLKIMAGYADVEAAPLVSQKSVVLEQPTLEPVFYRARESEYSFDPNLINLGYFGEFYSTRGLDEVLQGIAALTAEERSRVHLHVFTSNVEAAEGRFHASGINGVFSANQSLPYFEFLNALQKLDVLIVNDAATASHHPINPYLPSKLSDYKGSGTDIWTVYENGSPMSLFPASYRSPIGDSAAATDVLRKMIRGAYTTTPTRIQVLGTERTQGTGA